MRAAFDMEAAFFNFRAESDYGGLRLSSEWALASPLRIKVTRNSFYATEVKSKQTCSDRYFPGLLISDLPDSRDKFLN